DDPEGHQAHDRAAAILDAAPVRRKISIHRAAYRLDDAIQILAHFGKPHRPVFVEAITAFESERETHVQQLEERDVAARLADHTLQNLEELVAAAGLAMERDEQGLPRPFTLRAPRCVENGLVDD